MRCASFIVAMAALSAASALQIDFDNLWTKAGTYKVMEACLGKNVTVQYAIRVQKALRECNKGSSDGFQVTEEALESSVWNKIFDEFAANVTKVGANATLNTNGTNVGLNSTNVGLNNTNVGLNSTNVGLNSTNVGVNSSNGVGNTNVGLNSRDVNLNSTNGGVKNVNVSASANASANNPEMYAPLVDKIRCAYRGLGIIKDNNEIDMNKIREDYRAMNLDRKLEDDLLAGIDQCYEISQCLPLDEQEVRVPKDLLRLKIFLKCSEHNLRNWVCFREYLKGSATSCNV